MPSEWAGRFERLCFRALAEGAISEAKASELLETSVYDLSHQMESPPFQEESSSEMDLAAETRPKWNGLPGRWYS